MDARKNIVIGFAALAVAASYASAPAYAAPLATRLHARRVPTSSGVQNRQSAVTAPRVASRRYYHSNPSPNYYGDTVVVATPYGWQVLTYPTYYYPNGLPYYGPYSGWNSPPTPEPVMPGPSLNLSPLGPVPTQPLLGPIPKAGQSPLGSAPSGSIMGH